MLVVIVIIGILATISVATFGNYISDSREAVLQNSVSELSTQIKLQAIEASLTASIIRGGDGIDYSSISAFDIVEEQGISFSDGKLCYGSGDGGFVISGHLVVAEGDDPEFFVKGTPAGITAFNEMDVSEKDECNFLASNPDFTTEESISFDKNGIASVDLPYYYYCSVRSSATCWIGVSASDTSSLGAPDDCSVGGILVPIECDINVR